MHSYHHFWDYLVLCFIPFESHENKAFGVNSLEMYPRETPRETGIEAERDRGERQRQGQRQTERERGGLT